MSMLAQDLLDGYASIPREQYDRTEAGRFELEAWDHAFRLLNPPWEGNHIPPVHRALLPAIAREAEQLAQPIYFEPDLVQDARRVLTDRESFRILLRTAHIPYTPCFLEWDDDDGTRYGLLVEGDEFSFGFHLFRRSPNKDIPPHSLAKGRGTLRPGDGVSLIVDDKLAVQSREYLVTAVRQMFVFLALVGFTSISGTTHSERTRFIRHPDRFDALRRKAGKPALLSYNICRMRMPAPDAENQDRNVHCGSGVRWHLRIGYLRISRHGSPEPYFIWVPAQWRGNSDLGVVMKAREIGLSGCSRRHIDKHGASALRAIPESELASLGVFR